MSLASYLLNIRKLNNIGRWANEFLHRRASVAEHSFCVAQIAQMLGVIEESFVAVIDWKRIYRKALNHDVPESLMGDVISTTKNLIPQAKEAFETVETELVDNHLLAALPEEYKPVFREIVMDGKDETTEGLILSAADQIDALIECLQEIQLANTEPFTEKYVMILNKIEQNPLKSVRYFLDKVLPDLGILPQ